MQAELEELRENGIEVVAVSADTPEELRTKVLSKGITFPLLADPELTVIDAYGLRHPGGNPFGGDIARPAVFLIDEKGAVAAKLLPDNWRVRPTPGDLLEYFENG